MWILLYFYNVTKNIINAIVLRAKEISKQIKRLYNRKKLNKKNITVKMKFSPRVSRYIIEILYVLCTHVLVQNRHLGINM